MLNAAKQTQPLTPLVDRIEPANVKGHVHRVLWHTLEEN